MAAFFIDASPLIRSSSRIPVAGRVAGVPDADWVAVMIFLAVVRIDARVLLVLALVELGVA
jgi:hypothetical protein